MLRDHYIEWHLMRGEELMTIKLNEAMNALQLLNMSDLLSVW